MSDQEEQEEEARAPKELRDYADRMKADNEQLKVEIAELRTTNRTVAMRQAGLDPNSWTGKSVLAAIEQNNISDPDDIANLVRVVQAEKQGA